MKRTLLFLGLCLAFPLLGQSQGILSLPSYPLIYDGDIQWINPDQDADLDLFLCGKQKGAPFVCQILVNDTPAPPAVTLPVPELSFPRADWADYDGDNLPDCIISGMDRRKKPRVFLFHNDGSWQFSSVSHSITPLYGGALKFGDFDEDGNTDVFINGFSRTELYQSLIFLGNGTGSFQPGMALDSILAPVATFTDFEGDGDPDLMMMGRDLNDSLVLSTWRNDSTLGFASVAGPSPFQVGCLDFADIDLDGDADLVICGASGPYFHTRIYTFDSIGFSLLTDTLSGIYQGAAKWADCDGDNDPDLLISGWGIGGPLTKYYENAGASGFIERTVSLPGCQESHISFGDANGDGLPDLYLSGFDQNWQEVGGVYINQGGTSPF